MKRRTALKNRKKVARRIGCNEIISPISVKNKNGIHKAWKEILHTNFFWPISVKIEPTKCPDNLFSHSEQKMPARKYARFRSKIKMGYTKLGWKYFTLLFLADFGQNLTDQMP